MLLEWWLDRELLKQSYKVHYYTQLLLKSVNQYIIINRETAFW